MRATRLRHGCWTARILLMSMVFVLPATTWAFSCRDLGGDMQVTFPSVIALHANMVPGTMLTGFTPANGTMRWECRYQHGESASLLFNSAHPHLANRSPIQLNGTEYAVFPTSMPDVGALVEVTAGLQTQASATQSGPIAMTGGMHLISSLPGGATSNTTSHPPAGRSSEIVAVVNTFRMALVYLGGKGIAAGALHGGVIGDIGWTVGQPRGVARPGMQYGHAIHYNTVQFVSPTCTIPDLTVIMPPRTLNRFQGAGEEAGAWHPFSVNVQNCPSGIKQIRFRFNRPNAGLLDERGQVMRGGHHNMMTSARGIGIQLAMDDTLASLIHFGSEQRFMAPTETFEQGGAFTIPFKARYVKPAGLRAGAGAIHAAVAFELNYD
jgi:type 1 fimbria pilin